MSNYKALLIGVNTFIFDYDGVLTDGTVYPSPDGEMMRAANVKDGYALQLAVKKGYKIAVISGGKSKTMEKRLEALKITETILFVKQHSVNCIAASLYFMTIKFPFKSPNVKFQLI